MPAPQAAPAKDRLVSIVCVFMILLPTVFGEHLFGVKDVCAIGGGAGGFSMSLLLKDLGYDVAIFEELPVLGGCCNTVTFDAPPGQQNWIDPGVIAILNTTWANERGLGPWGVDTAALFGDLLPPDSLVPVPFPNDIAVYAVDLNHNKSLGLQNGTLPPGFNEALGRFLAICAQYPWLDNTLNKPDPLPAELLVPWSDFVAAHQLEPFVSVIEGILYGGGMGNYSKLTALYALMNVGPSVILAILAGNTGVFSFKGGCIQFYNAATQYLGPDNVLTDARIERLIRPPAGHPDLPSLLIGHVIGQNGHRRPFTYFCGKTVIAFSPTLQALTSFMDLDAKETAVFSKVRRRFYYAVTANVSGPLADTAPGYFEITNLDPAQPFSLPESPTVLNMFRGIPYGPVEAPSFSETPISDEEMRGVIQSRFDGVPSELLTSVQLTHLFPHVFQAHFSADDLATSPSPYSLLQDLKLHRNTWWSSNLNTFASHAHIFNGAADQLADFPAKHPTARRRFAARASAGVERARQIDVRRKLRK